MGNIFDHEMDGCLSGSLNKTIPCCFTSLTTDIPLTEKRLSNMIFSGVY